MGGHIRQKASGERVPVVVGTEFDVVISLYSKDGHGPPAPVEHHCREIPDGPLTAAQLADACELAAATAAAVRTGRKVLVRCRSGYNRSGLVVVQALVHLGYRVDDAIFLVRYRRSKWALNNQLFVDYLTTGLDVASLLADLNGRDPSMGGTHSSPMNEGSVHVNLDRISAASRDVLLVEAKTPNQLSEAQAWPWQGAR